METLEFLTILIITGAVLVIISRYFNTQESIARIKLQKDAQIRSQNQKAAQSKLGTSRIPQQQALAGDELGAWVPALLEGFGIDPEVLFDEEMPAELKTFLPIIKGYVQAQGGLPGIAAKLQGGASSNQDDERAAI
jgi:hypothetical protein